MVPTPMTVTAVSLPRGGGGSSRSKGLKQAVILIEEGVARVVISIAFFTSYRTLFWAFIGKACFNRCLREG